MSGIPTQKHGLLEIPPSSFSPLAIIVFLFSAFILILGAITISGVQNNPNATNAGTVLLFFSSIGIITAIIIGIIAYRKKRDLNKAPFLLSQQSQVVPNPNEFYAPA